MALQFDSGAERDPAAREAAAVEQYVAGLVREAEMTMRSPRLLPAERAANVDAIRVEVERVGGDVSLLPEPDGRVTRQSVQAASRSKGGRPRKSKAGES